MTTITIIRHTEYKCTSLHSFKTDVIDQFRLLHFSDYLLRNDTTIDEYNIDRIGIQVADITFMLTKV